MKKIILVLGIVLLTIASAAWLSNIFGGSTTVINQSPAASFMTGLTQKVQNNLNDIETDFYQSRDCADAARKYEKLSDVVMPYELMNVAASKNKNLNCTTKFMTNEVVFYAWGSFSFCHRPDYDVSLNNASTFGMSGMHPYDKWVTEFNNLNNANLKTRLYKGSKGTLQGLLAKDIDWGFIATPVAINSVQQGTIVCPYTTDPTSEKFLGKYFSHSYPAVRFEVLTLAKGNTDKVREKLNNAEFRKYLSDFGYSFVDFDFTEMDRHNFELDFIKLQKSY
jgi:hypothetical protein